MKIGLSTAAFYGKWEVEEAAALLGRYGAECAEVFLQTRSEYAREFARLVRKNLNGVPCTSVHPFGTAFENEFFARQPGRGRTRWIRFDMRWMRRRNLVRICMYTMAGILRRGLNCRLNRRETRRF